MSTANVRVFVKVGENHQEILVSDGFGNFGHAHRHDCGELCMATWHFGGRADAMDTMISGGHSAAPAESLVILHELLNAMQDKWQGFYCFCAPADSRRTRVFVHLFSRKGWRVSVENENFFTMII